MINPPKTLKTERLRLRKAKLSDAEAIFHQYAQDPEVIKYVSWRAHKDLGETREYMRMCQLAWDVGKAFHWVIEHNDVLASAHWGLGYMTEALKALVAWALTQQEIYRIWAVCDVDNLASARVMEKAGMQREGILRRWSVHPNLSNEPRDSYCYAIVK